MQLKPTVLAYFRVMAAHLVGRIQPPPVSPLAEATAPLACRAAAATATEAGGEPQPVAQARMSASAPAIGVVGGGVLGTSLALRLAQAGAKVTVLERGPSLGGLAGDDGLRRPPGRPLLPRDHARRRAHDRDGRGGRARRPAALHPGRRRLLRRRRDARLQRRRRPAALLAADARWRGCASAGSSPSASCAAPTTSSRTIPLETWLRRHCGNAGLSSGSGSRCSTRASTATPRGCRPPTSGRAPGACPAPAAQGRRRRGDGPHRRRPPAADRRDGRAGARSSGVETRTDAPVEGLATGEDGAVTGVELGGRDARRST